MTIGLDIGDIVVFLFSTLFSIIILWIYETIYLVPLSKDVESLAKEYERLISIVLEKDL